MRALVACLVCLVGCASSTYLEPLGEPAPDAVIAETQPDVAAPALDVAPDARVEPTREASAQVDAAPLDAERVEAEPAEAAAEVRVPDVAEAAVEVAADAAPEVEAVDAGPARFGEACGPSRPCEGADLPIVGSGGYAHRCVTDPHPIPLGPGLEPIATSCVMLCRSGSTTGPSSGCWTGCCATIGEEDGGLLNVCLGPENCK